MRLILISLLLLSGCASPTTSRMYLEMDHKTGEASGWTEHNGERMDIKIVTK